MKIILLQDEKKLGKKGDIIEASEGYARNYILPKKIGVEATSKNMNDLRRQDLWLCIFQGDRNCLQGTAWH